MKDRYHKKANVLGIDVSVMRVDKAVNVSMELMRGKGLPVIYFLSAISSLLCQNNEQSAEYVKSCNLILAGDRHIEMAVHHRQDNGQIPEGIGEFADNYLKRLFSKINREGRSIYMVMEQESYLESMEEYMEESYRNIEVHGNVMRKETKGEADRIVNEINACIPDIVFVCIPAERQMKFMEKHAAMMNTRLCILIESVQPLIRKETEEIPSWVEVGFAPPRHHHRFPGILLPLPAALPVPENVDDYRYPSQRTWPRTSLAQGSLEAIFHFHF